MSAMPESTQTTTYVADELRKLGMKGWAQIDFERALFALIRMMPSVNKA